MRRFIVSTAVSADGFQSGPGDDLSAMPFDGGFSPHNLRLLRSASTMLMGRVGYLGFASYWPRVLDDPEQPQVERDIAAINNPIHKLVISDSLTDADLGAWATTTRVVGRADAVDAVRELKEQPGDDIVTFGAATTWSPLAAAGLVDELYLLVGPAVLGRGEPFYVGPRLALELLDASPLPDSALLALHYAVHADGA